MRRSVNLFMRDILLVLSVFLLLEAVLRLVAPQHLQIMLRDVYEPVEKYIGYQFKENARSVCDIGFGTHVFETNSWRCRDREYGPKEQGEWRILSLGDSFSENLALAVDDIYPNALELKLAQSFPAARFSVINAGMAGWGLWTYYEYLRDMLPVMRPDVVIIAVSASDDAVREAEPPPVRPKKILAGLPVNKDASPGERINWGFWYANQMLECHSHAYQLFRRVTNFPFYWIKIDKHVLFHPMSLYHDHADKVFEPTRSLLAKINELCGRHGARMMMLHVVRDYECLPGAAWWKIQMENPCVTMLDVSRPARFMERMGKRLDVPVYDPSEDLAACPDETYFPIFLHWNAKGNQVVADGLYRFLLDNNLLGLKKGQP